MEAKGYRDGCAKCAEAAREAESLRAQIKAARERPTWVVRFDGELVAASVAISLIVALVFGLCWIIAGSVPWVGRAGVVVAVVVALAVFLGWSDVRDRSYRRRERAVESDP